MDADLLRRALDLSRQAEKYAEPRNTGFLSPAEQQELRALCARERLSPVFHGGGPDCERQMAFFLPSWLVAEALDPAQAIGAVRIDAPFGAPGHRDYLGAILGLGLRRDTLGDLRAGEAGAELFCSLSIAPYLLQNLEKVGRFGVKPRQIPLAEVPAPQRQYKSVSFTVQSLRLDAVCGGVFGLSRTSAQAQILAGNVNVNYLPCLKPDAPLHEGDIISLRGSGKATLLAPGGTSRKGRQFIRADLWK